MNKIFDTVKTILDKNREEATFFLFWLKETFIQVKFINWYTLNGKFIFFCIFLINPPCAKSNTQKF